MNGREIIIKRNNSPVSNKEIGWKRGLTYFVSRNLLIN